VTSNRVAMAYDSAGGRAAPNWVPNERRGSGSAGRANDSVEMCLAIGNHAGADTGFGSAPSQGECRNLLNIITLILNHEEQTWNRSLTGRVGLPCR
jgi:hypothetical protein